jgi:hypothetical protein
MKSKLLTLLVVLSSQAFFAQQRTCGVREATQAMLNNPIHRAVYLEEKARFEQEYQRLLNTANRNANTTNATNVVTRVPIAVHYTTSSSALATATSGVNLNLKNCLIALAQTQINILNADYNATNTDLNLWTNTTTGASQFFPGIDAGSMGIQFELATQNHPASSGLTNGQPAVTFGYNFGNGSNFDSAWAGYFNIIIRNLGGGTLGFSPLPGSLSQGFGVTIDNNFFSSGAGCSGTGSGGVVPTAPFNRGRTLTHEMGHFFNLDHTFVECDGTNCATSGDRVCDTPATSTETYGCPAADATFTDCTGELSLTMNYMDYTNDACMYMFTAGQVTRMNARLNVIRSTIRQGTLSNDTFVKNNFTLYPNPNKGTFTLQFKELLTNYAIEVFDVTGRVVFENNYNQNSELTQNIAIPNPSRGVYFVNVKSGDVIVTNKIIVD